MMVEDVMVELEGLAGKMGKAVKSVGGDSVIGEMELVGANGRSVYFQVREVEGGVVDVKWDVYENDGGRVGVSSRLISTDNVCWVGDLELVIKQVFKS